MNPHERKTMIAAVITLFVMVGTGIFLMTGGQDVYYNIRMKAFAREEIVTGQTVFLGDSITEMFDLDCYFGDCSDKLYNRGISGDKVQGVIDRLDTSVFELQPTRLFVLIGVNDYSKSNNEYIVSKYRELAEHFATLEDCDIYWMSVMPVKGREKTAKIQNLNLSLEQICAEYGYQYIDVFTVLQGENGVLDPRYTPDGLHLNSKGYDVVAAELRDIVVAE